MEIPQGNTLEKAQVTSPEAISGIADSLKLEEQKLIEWLSKAGRLETYAPGRTPVRLQTAHRISDSARAAPACRL